MTLQLYQLAVDALPFGKEAFAGIAADDVARIFENVLKAIHRRRLHPTDEPGGQVAQRLALKDTGLPL